MGMEVRKECMLKEVIFPMVREYGIRIKYAHPMIQFILTMMTLFFIFQRKYVKFQFIAQPIKAPRTTLGAFSFLWLLLLTIVSSAFREQSFFHAHSFTREWSEILL